MVWPWKLIVVPLRYNQEHPQLFGEPDVVTDCKCKDFYCGNVRQEGLKAEKEMSEWCQQ